MKFVEPLFAALDAQDSDTAVSFLTPDAQLRFGNTPPLRGRAAIARSFDDFFETIEAVRHDLVGVWAVDDVVVCELEIAYKLFDGRTIVVPCVDVFRMEGDQVADYRVFVDVAPLSKGQGG